MEQIQIKKGGQDANKRRAIRRLALQSTKEMLELIPNYSIRPTAVIVDLYGCNFAVLEMIKRMKIIAYTPLEKLLAEPLNIGRYRKVCAYLLFARICTAQLKAPCVAGVELPNRLTITTDQLEFIDGLTNEIPNFLAWILCNVGTFELEAQVVPWLLPNLGLIREAIQGNFESLCDYVSRHQEGEQGIDIPEEDLALINILTGAYPLTVEHRRFNSETVKLMQCTISPEEWLNFVNINKALEEQGCCVSLFKFSDAIGTEVACVRFLKHDLAHVEHKYYCCNVISDACLRSALVLRLGCDEFIPENQKCGNNRGMFIGSPDQAPLIGHDIPACFLAAQLTMINRC